MDIKVAGWGPNHLPFLLLQTQRPLERSVVLRRLLLPCRRSGCEKAYRELGQGIVYEPRVSEIDMLSLIYVCCHCRMPAGSCFGVRLIETANCDWLGLARHCECLWPACQAWPCQKEI